MARKRSDPADVEIGRRIRTHRLRRGLSQAELARRIGVTFQQLQKYEKGENRVRPARLIEIARALKLPLDVLFHGGEPEGAPASAAGAEAAYLQTPGAARLLSAYARVSPPALRRAILAVVERLVAGGLAAKRDT